MGSRGGDRSMSERSWGAEGWGRREPSLSSVDGCVAAILAVAGHKGRGTTRLDSLWVADSRKVEKSS